MIILTFFLTLIFISSTVLGINHIVKLKKRQSLKTIVIRWIKKSKGKKHDKLRKGLKVSSMLLLIGGYSFCCYNLSNRIAFIRSVSGGFEWRESNGQPYLYVEAGDHYNLGYLTGYALANKIHGLKALLSLQSLLLGKNYFDALSIGRQYLPYIPDDYEQELLGLSEGATAGSGFYVSFEDVLVQNLFFEILYGQKFLAAGGGCTNFGVVNSDNTTLIGQNVDLTEIIGHYTSFVLHKLDNEPLVFSFRIGAGMIPTAKNANNLTVIMNLVELSKIAPICTPVYIITREALANQVNATGFYDMITATGHSAYGINYIISDSKDIIAAQCSGDNQTCSTPQNISHSNTFLLPSWQSELNDPTYSVERQVYADSLLSNAYSDSNLILNELHSILGDIPIICRDEGGLFSSETVAFMTTHTFGFGNTNGNIGVLPI